jgi:hypothetical protein
MPSRFNNTVSSCFACLEKNTVYICLKNFDEKIISAVLNVWLPLLVRFGTLELLVGVMLLKRPEVF